MRFGLHTRVGRHEVDDFTSRLRSKIESAGGSIVQDGVVDLVVAVGGDGTMLSAVSEGLHHDVPVLGFNLGTLGFLTEAEPSELDSVVTRLIEGNYDVENRMTVQATSSHNRVIGINDVVVEKIDSTRLVSLKVAIDGVPLTTYRADGLIVATPTGSTAYSFSAGGPVVDPRVESLVLTPVASHSLFDRSVVVPASSRIEVTVQRDRPVRVNVDKTVLGELTLGDVVVIERGERPARFVTFGGSPFPALISDKFGLGV